MIIIFLHHIFWTPIFLHLSWPSALFSFVVQVSLFMEAVTVSDCCYCCVIQLKARHSRWARRIKTNYPPFFLLCKEPTIMPHIFNFGRIWELTHQAWKLFYFSPVLSVFFIVPYYTIANDKYSVSCSVPPRKTLK